MKSALPFLPANDHSSHKLIPSNPSSMPISPSPRRFSIGGPSSASGSRPTTPALFSLSSAFGSASASTPPPGPLSYPTLPPDALPPPPYTPDAVPHLVEGSTYIERARLVRLSRSGINLHSLETPAAPPPPTYVPPPPVFRHRVRTTYGSEPSSRRGSVSDVTGEGVAGTSYRARARRAYLGEDDFPPDRSASSTTSPPSGPSPVSAVADPVSSPHFDHTTLTPLTSSSSTPSLAIPQPQVPAPPASHSAPPPSPPAGPPDFTVASPSSYPPYAPIHLDSDAHFAFLLQTALSPPPPLDPAHPDETYSDRARRLLRERAERIQVLEALAQIEGFVMEATGGGTNEARLRRREEEERRERMELRRGSAGEEGEETYQERARRMLDERADRFMRFEAGEVGGRGIGV